MKNTHCCPKCRSTAIVAPRYSSAPSAGGYFDLIKLGTFSSVGIQRYVCTGCGYVEYWVEDKDKLKQLYEKYNDKG